MKRTRNSLLLLALFVPAWGQVNTSNNGVNILGALPAGANVVGAVTQSGNWSVRLQDGAGNTINSTSNALNVSVGNSTLAVTESGTWNVGSSTATGSAVPANAFYISGNGSGNLTGFVRCDTNANISQTGNTQVITGTSAKKIYVCAMNLVTATAQNIAVVEGTGTTCGTSTAAFPGTSGGSTAATGWNLAANSGIVLGGGLGPIGIEATNADNVCVLQSGSGQISGSIWYTVF